MADPTVRYVWPVPKLEARVARLEEALRACRVSFAALEANLRPMDDLEPNVEDAWEEAKCALLDIDDALADS